MFWDLYVNGARDWSMGWLAKEEIYETTGVMYKLCEHIP